VCVCVCVCVCASSSGAGLDVLREGHIDIGRNSAVCMCVHVYV